MQSGNLFKNIPPAAAEEAVEVLLNRPGVRLERIASHGHATPPGEWYDQETDEWVVLLSGRAWLRLEDPEQLLEMEPGDWMMIPAHRRHRVERTQEGADSVWLALHVVPAG
ncbi:MAG: cupin [Phycisphaeraceae bacterium]